MKIIALTLLASLGLTTAAFAHNKAGRNAASLASRLLASGQQQLVSRDGRSVATLTPSAIRVATKHADGTGETHRAYSYDHASKGQPARIRTTAIHEDGLILTQRGPAGMPGGKAGPTTVDRDESGGKEPLHIVRKK